VNDAPPFHLKLLSGTVLPESRPHI
jgi:hypothetical protein